MRITVIGTGYVGLVTGVGLAEMGNDVVCTVRDQERLRKLRRGIPTIYEQGLAELLKRNVKEARIAFTDNIPQAIRHGEMIFIAVGTPMGANGAADLSSVMDVATKLGRYLKPNTVVVTKSTVPVGTTDAVRKRILRSQRRKVPFTMASNPEFLREGTAVRDFLVPDRIIVGVDDSVTAERIRHLYQPIVRANQPLFITDIRSSEAIKYASNAFLATKISFINELSNYAEAVGADITAVAKGMGLDTRIGPRFLHAGIGYGGSCFPKDVRALIIEGKRHRIPFRILEAVEAVNDAQRQVLVKKLESMYPSLESLRIAVWGLTYKPKTDDVRDAPSLTILPVLVRRGAKVVAFDPIGVANAKQALAGLPITYVRDPYAALRGADALLILTEWDEFRSPDFSQMRKLMRRPVIVDGRNIYEAADAVAAGFTYLDIGRRQTVTQPRQATNMKRPPRPSRHPRPKASGRRSGKRRG